jgi:plastocyanin
MAAIAAAATASVLGSSAGASPGPPRLLVTGREYDLTLSRARIDPGHATIQFSNGGEDPHNLRIKRAGTAGNGHGAGKTAPGGLAEVTAHLRSGSRYVLWCSLSNHRALGMVAHLNVRG